jgi:alpha-beta hydrolase superfamily lysophospholipase
MNFIFKPWFFLAALLVAATHGAEQNGVISRDAKIDNVQLHYLMAGHGPAVILLHGFAETSRMWRPLIPLLAKKFTVIAPDCRGSATHRFQRIRST